MKMKINKSNLWRSLALTVVAVGMAASAPSFAQQPPPAAGAPVAAPPPGVALSLIHI